MKLNLKLKLTITYIFISLFVVIFLLFSVRYIVQSQFDIYIKENQRLISKEIVNQVNGCNREIIIPEYNLSHKLSEGDNLIEFTPTENGTVPFSCWMGMIRSSIVVE